MARPKKRIIKVIKDKKEMVSFTMSKELLTKEVPKLCEEFNISRSKLLKMAVDFALFSNAFKKQLKELKI